MRETRMNAYPIAIWILLRLVAAAIEQDGGTLLFSTGNQALYPLLALTTNNRAQINAFFESTVYVQHLGSPCDLVKPSLGFSHHDQCTEGHATLACRAKSRTHNGVQGVILVAIGQHGGVVLGPK